MRIQYGFSTAFLMSIALVGCGGDSAPTANEVQDNKAPAKKEVSEYVSPLPEDAPVYKVVTTGTQPPYTFNDENGKLQGIDIDIMRLIGEEQGFKVHFYPKIWEEVFPSVVTGNYDMAISGISYNDKRNEEYQLSNSYLFVPGAIMYKDESLNIKAMKDLEGLKYAGMKGSKPLQIMNKNSITVDLIETENVFDAYQELARGNADAISEDIHWLKYMAQSYPELKVKIIAYETETDPGSQQIIMFEKGNTELAKLVNEGIDKLKAKGKIAEIEHKWIHDPK